MLYLISNLKANKTLNEITVFEEFLRKKGILTNLNLIVCPSNIFLGSFKGTNYSLGIQDVSKYSKESLTGEVSAKQLASMDVKYAIVGHSERRNFFQEKTEDIITKINNALSFGISPIYCIGETKEMKEKNLTNSVIERQLATVMNDFTREELKNFIIAYEPVWAIGSGITPTATDIQETIFFIKNLIMNYYELDLPVLYGGSINSKNIASYVNNIDLDGFLVGKSSLDINEFNEIIDILVKNRQ